MKELTLEHLAPYLPYGLKCQTNLIGNWNNKEGLIIELSGLVKNCARFDIKNEHTYCYLHEIKPILRPLNDYAKINEILEEFSMKTISLFRLGLEHGVIDLPYNVAILFFKNHIDLFNLIPQGLAIDINTINELK